MDRRQDGTAASAFAAGLVPAQGERFAMRSGRAAEGRATRREAAGRPPPVSFLRNRTAAGAALRESGSARRRVSHDRSCLSPARAQSRGRARNAITEILTR